MTFEFEFLGSNVLQKRDTKRHLKNEMPF